jgi:NADH dehydrogenase
LAPHKKKSENGAGQSFERLTNGLTTSASIFRQRIPLWGNASEENFFLFTPMLHEVAASDLDLTHIVNPIRKMLRHVRFFEGEVQSVDLGHRCVVVAHGFDQHTHSLEYDHIVFALGCVTNFYTGESCTLSVLGEAQTTRQ